MSPFVLFLLFATSMGITKAWPKYEILLWNVTCTGAEAKFTKLQCSLSDSAKAFSMAFVLAENAYIGTVSDKTIFSNGEGLAVPVMSHQFNGCQFLQGLSDLQNVMLQYLLSKLRQANISNMPGKCPLEKETEYFINNLYIDDDMLPPYLPQFRFDTTVNVMEYDKALLHMEVLGEIRRKN